ncbi:hypothetical protein [Breoghania sp.]|uniref:hypothetical protein n=1 Tax=Breoghania sp. TaxID=2065378 RepID=UPI0029CA11A7|nr:hypothetical protein [Breoghania sp.]
MSLQKLFMIAFAHMIFVASSFAAGSDQAETAACLYANRLYTPGASYCECPTVTAFGVGTATGSTEGNRIQSRRMTCSPEGAWVTDGSLCMDIRFNGPSYLMSKYDELRQEFCPATNVTATSAADEVTADTAEGAAAVIFKSLCRKFPAVRPACATLIGN